MFLEKYRKVVEPAGKTCTPVIDLEKCKGCGYCVRICPLGALRVKNKKAVAEPWMKMGDNLYPSCFGCRDCTAVCPEGAITVEGAMVIEEGYYKSQYPQRPIKLPEPLGESKPMNKDMDGATEVERVIYRRRSNRIFKKDPVPSEMIDRLLEAGRYAPTAGNSQTVKYIVVNDKAVIDEIKDGIMPVLTLLADNYRRKNFFIRTAMSWYGLKKPGDMDIRPIYAVAALNAPGSKLHLFHHAPTLIIVLGDRRSVSDYRLDCGIAAQNIVLAAHSLGLGTCYVGFSKLLKFNRKLKKKLGIKKPYEVLTSICVGYPKVPQDGIVPRERTPVVWIGPR